MSGEELSVETSGETVGEAKWLALRELERAHPGLDKASVRFQVVSEGERGLLGVGFTPARVVASVDRAAEEVAPPAERSGESDLAAEAREVVERITAGIGVRCRVEAREDDETLTIACVGEDLGLLIGKHGQTIDAVQYLLNAILWRGNRELRKEVVVDAAGYRDRRRATLESLALRNAEQVRTTGRTVSLEPMTAVERKIVHLRLQVEPGVATRSDGSEPNRYVVIVPQGE